MNITLNKYIILLFLTFFLCNSFANNLDSLLNVLSKTNEDTTKINLMNDIFKKYRSKNRIKAKEYAEKSLKLSLEIDYKKGSANAYHNLAILHHIKGEYEEALVFYNKSLTIRKEINDKKKIASSYNNIGVIYKSKGLYDKALDIYEKSLKIKEEIGDKKGVGSTFINIGVIYEKQGDYNKALDYFFKGLKINEEIDSKKNIAVAYNNIGNIYELQLNYDQAIKYYFKSLKIREKTNNDKGIALVYNNIGLVYQAKSDYKNALFYLKKSLEMKKKHKDKRGIAYTQNNIGTLYFAQKQYNKALEYYNKSLKTKQEIGDKKGVAESCKNIGVYYSKLGNYEKAIQFLKKSLVLAKKMKALSIIRDVANSLSNIYSIQKNYKQAYEYHFLFKQSADSLHNKENTEQITKLGMQYSFDKKQKIQELEQQKKDVIKEAEIRKQKEIKNYLFAVLILVLLFLFTMIRSYRIKKKDNRLLEQQNLEIRFQKEEIQKQAEDLTKANKEITIRNKEITYQKEEIEKKSNDILASINYAQKIQQAMLPPYDLFNDIFPNNFVLFRPRDIVSGDYYWATRRNNRTFIAAADCTGHGVPGAFMSMLGISFLNEIVNKRDGQSIKAGEILTALRHKVKKSLHQTGKANEAKDGMDIALCIIDTENMNLQYSGAYNPLILIRSKSDEKEMIQVKADRMPIGIHLKEKPTFTNHEIDIEKGDVFYLFSDGFIDQFGGKDGRKFMSRNFKNTLVELADKPMKQQKEILDDIFDNWKGEKYNQLDDVLVLGVRIA